MKTRKMTKLVGMLVATLMMLAVLGTFSVIPAFAADPAYSGGSGTADDPYLLSTPEDLVALSNAIANDDGSLDAVDACGLGMYHGYYFVLTQDIDMTGVAWTPVSFCGNLDGKGFAIKNLNMTATDNGDGEYWTGFFAQLINATVSDITFENCTATVDGTVESSRDIYASIVAANAIASKLEGVTVVGSSITHAGKHRNFSYAGFIVAYADICNLTGCRVEDSTMDVSAPATGTEIGGILGGMGDMFFEYIYDYGNPYNMTIGVDGNYGLYDCYVDATMTSSTIGYTAGIVGWTCTDFLDDTAYMPERNGVAVEIKNCVFVGDITVTSANGIAAGISGFDEPEDVIDGCVNLGTLSAPTVYALGELPATVTNSYYVSDAEDGNGGYTAAQFTDGTVCAARGGHVVDADATCQNPDTCALCGELAGAHTAGAECVFDATNHYLLCAQCGETLTATAEAHDGAEDCSVCGWINMTAEDLQMAINALESAVADLETAVNTKDAELAGKITSLETAMTNAQNAITALQNNISGTTEMELLRTAVSRLKDAQISLQEAVDTLTQRLDKAVEDIKALQENDKATNEQIKELILQVKLAEATLKATGQANKIELSNMLTEATGALQDAVDDLTERLTAAEGDVATLKTNIKTAQDAIAALQDGSATKTELGALQEALDQAKETYDAAIAQIKKDLSDAKTALETAIAKGDKDLADEITALKTALATAEAAAKTEREDLAEALDAAKASLKESIKAVQKNLDDAKAALEAAIAAGDTKLDEKIANLNAATKELEDALAAAQAALESADAETKEELEGVIKTVQNTLKAAMEAGDKANADALAEEVARLREEIAQTKKDAQVVPIVIACIAIVGDIAILWVVVLKRKRFMGMSGEK